MENDPTPPIPSLQITRVQQLTQLRYSPTTPIVGNYKGGQPIANHGQ